MCVCVCVCARAHAHVHYSLSSPQENEYFMCNTLLACLKVHERKAAEKNLQLPLYVCTYVCISLSACIFRRVWLSATPWTVCSPPRSSVHRILQERILEWVAISSSRGSSWPSDWTCLSSISRQILYHWATWEVHLCISHISSLHLYADI